MSDLLLPDLSKEVASYLNTHIPFQARFTARHNSNVVYPITELKEIRADIWPCGLALSRQTRVGLSTVYTLNLAIQQRSPSQETTDSLTNLSDAVLRFLLMKRFADSEVYSFEGSFIGTDVFDRLVRYEENVFQSVMEINFRKDM